GGGRGAAPSVHSGTSWAKVMEEVLIVGGDLAAAKAALELAEAGVHVHLVTAGPGLESGQTDADAWRAMPTLLAATRHPHITLHTAAQVARIEEGAASSHVILQQSPHFVDSDRCTACSVCVEVCPITLDDGRTAIRRPPPGSAPTAYTILKRGTSPCRTACPTDQRAQGYIALIAAGRYEDAYRVIQEDNPFPAICGRVCNHRCEDNCTRGQVDEPVSIRALKRFVADWMWEQVADCNLQIADCRPQTPARGERIAVVGSGPAGLTAARDLVRLGYTVTVFEALPVAGGMMRVGIPEFRLPREMLEWDIEQILDEGVELRLNCRVEDVEALFNEGYSAVLLATGLHESVRLPIPGSDLPGVLGATDFMRQTNLDHPPDLTARRVVVLGGGNVAIDVARTAVRLGAAEVAMAFLEARGEMPSFAWEVEETEAEGVVLYPNRTFKAITAENGRVTGVRLVEVDFRGFVDGRPDFDELPGTEHVLPADVVVWAIGQTADLSFLPDGGPIGKTHRAIVHDPDTLMTDRPGVFVAGDVASGVTFFVVDAVSSGHRAARSIHRYLQGQPMEEGPRIQPEARPPEEELARVERRPRARSRILPVAERVDNFHEVDLGLTEEQARAEAARCLCCGICSECLECQIRCPPGAIDHTRQPRTLTLNVDAVLRVGDEGFEEALRMHRPEEPVPGDLSPSPGLTATPS
nr:FAD-binding protein [Anaerolineae bacterium]